MAISHGKSGTPWSHRGLGAHLARAGFAVVLIEHPGNSRADNSLDGTPANLANRPRHVRFALDAAFADAALGPHLAPGRAAVIGHSMGGYTALAVAGGRPMALPHETGQGVAQPVPVEPDARVRALILFAPALPWFMGPGALAEVRVPLLVRCGERDEYIPPFVIERILSGLPAGARMDYQVVPGAGHFSFNSPSPPALAGPNFPPSQDPPSTASRTSRTSSPTRSPSCAPASSRGSRRRISGRRSACARCPARPRCRRGGEPASAGQTTRRSGCRSRGAGPPPCRSPSRAGGCPR